MNNRCASCRLVNFPGSAVCGRCGASLSSSRPISTDKVAAPSRLLPRIGICALVLFSLLLGFYLSLIGSAGSLSIEQKYVVRQAIAVLKERGFDDEVRLLNTLTVYRSTDNWLNASVAKESAYAATNFPFEIMTLYSDFFAYPQDDVERAAILLHESRHLAGADEHDAYEFVWKNREQLGWTRESYGNSPVWQNVRRQTRDNVPEIFVCDGNDFGDCTQPR